MLITMKTSVVVAAAILAFSSAQASKAGSAPSKTSVISEDVRASFIGLSAVEIPAQAAKIVNAAKKEHRLATAKLILKEILNHRPQMAVQLTASIVRVAPETAPLVTSWAAAMVPQFGDQIIRAAAVSAPEYAAEIAVTAARTFPSSKTKIVQMVALAVPSAAAKIETVFNSAPVRMTSGAVAQEAVTGGNIVTYNGQPIGFVAPVPAPDSDDPDEPVEERELVFFPETLENITQVRAGAPGTDVSRIPEEQQEVIKEQIKEVIFQREVALQVEAFKEANDGAEPTAEQLEDIKSSIDIDINDIDLQESLEIDPAVTLETINNAIENNVPIEDLKYN